MRTDTYMKVVLTIIAVCLLYLSARDILVVRKVHADAPIKVVLTTASGSPIAGVGDTGSYLFVMTTR